MKKTAALLALALPLVGHNAQAATFELDLTANGDSRWTDYFSAAYTELGREWKGDQVADGFFLLSNDEEIGSGVDTFPFEAAFSAAGSVEYDDAGTTGNGIETFNITGLSTSFLTYVVPAGFATSWTESSSNANGTVTLVDGEVSSINLTSDIAFTGDFSGLGAGFLPFSGSFDITGDTFALLVDTTYPFGGNDLRYEWDVSGSVNGLTPVPLPAAFWLFGSALLGLVGAARRRKVAA